MFVRTGIGIDMHTFEKHISNQNLEVFIVLGGVQLKNDRNVKSHSDGDVLLHAISDAIYGAIAKGNIGTHFPPTDEKLKNANSRIFVEHALALLKDSNFTITNIDTTVMCERPKIMQYSDVIRANIAEIADLKIDQISIKATSFEGLFPDCIMAYAVCTVQKQQIL